MERAPMAENDIDDEAFTPADLEALAKSAPNAPDCLAKEVLTKSLSAKAKGLITRGSSIIILKVPDAEWVEVIVRPAVKLASTVTVYTATERNSAKRTEGDVGANALHAVQRGRCLIFISQDPQGILDAAVLTAADMVVTIAPPTTALLRKVIKSVTGGRARGVTPDMAALPITAIVTAIRPGISARECVANLQRSILPPQAKTTSAVPPLADLPLAEDLRQWADSTLAELEAVKAKYLGPDALIFGVLEGEPGSGKTLLARSLAESSGWTFVSTSVGEWFTSGDSNLGSVAKNLKAFIDRAMAAEPAVAFLDELDALPNRATMDARGRDWWVPIITLFLTEIDRLRASRTRVLLLGATNFFERLDAALIRPGRLQQRIAVRAPHTREEILDVFRFYLGSDLAEADLLPLAQLGLGATPAMVEGWVREARAAARGAGRPLSIDDVLARIIPEDNRLPSDIQAIALHEAGHALIAHRLGHKVDLISIVPQGTTGGHIRSAFPTLVPTLAHIRDMATIMLGGRAADLVLGRGANSGAASDLEGATRLLIDAHEKQGLGQSLLFGPAATGKPSAVTISAVANELPILLRRAMGMVEAERELAIMLAERLAEFKVLSGAEVIKLLGAGPLDAMKLETKRMSRLVAEPTVGQQV
ncbi:AAA family ATPase [Devosia sp. L53-10-65]|uniref:AAA family ATPase n=2 Tax=Devosia marina TaxID=2683198 RepID=A0A7X3FQ94_9HYPH|nr:AAA family ATPase [Devosia marina]